MLTVQPMMRLGENTGLFMVVFNDLSLPMGLSVNPTDKDETVASRGRLDRAADEMIEQLERELAATGHIRLQCDILVVDDQRDVRFLSRRFLSDAGANVSEAEDGEQAVAMMAKSMEDGYPFDLAVWDMQMPKLDGYETAVQMRALGYTHPIIALTADAMQGDMSRCIANGCNSYLSKPIDKSALLNMIEDYLNSTSA